MLVACIEGPTSEAIQQQIVENESKADLFELRADLYPLPNLSMLKSLTAKPFIVSNAYQNAEYIDVPLPHWKTPTFLKEYPDVKWICSYHNFDETPQDLHSILASMKDHPAYLYKIVTMANNAVDGLRMLQLVRDARAAGVRIVGHCMGEWGEYTRVVGRVMGNHWSYCAAAGAVAPGQLSLAEMSETYRYSTLNPSTELYGLIGYPVRYSRSHITHNREFGRLEKNALYVKINVRPEELELFLPKARSLGFRGLSVTMPFKEPVGRLCTPPLETSNTLSLSETITGINTDGPAALDLLSLHRPVAGTKALIIGYGGLGKAIAHSLTEAGAHCTILNRTAHTTTRPLEDWNSINQAEYTFIVQATSVGMNDPASAPVDWSRLKSHQVVLESISYPNETQLVKAARAKGCAVITGKELFSKQAERQFDWWGCT